MRPPGAQGSPLSACASVLTLGWRKHRARLFAVAALCGAAIPCNALILNWDADGVFPVNGGAGVWNTSDARWEDGTGGYMIWNNSTLDSAVLGGTAGTVALGETITVGALTITTAGYGIDLNGSNFTVASIGGAGGTVGTTRVFNNSGATATFTTGNLGGAGPRLSGNINVTLNGTTGWTPVIANDFTGTLHFKPTGTASATILPGNADGLGSRTGLIKLDASNLTATASANINWSTPDNTQFHTFTRDIELIHGATNFAQFQVNGARQVTLSGVISGGTAGGAGLRMTNGQGNLVLSGANTYSGSTVFTGQSAMLTLANDQALGATSGVSFTSGGLQTLAFRGGVNINLPSILVDLGSTNPAASGYGTLHALSGDNVLTSTVQTTSSSTSASLIGAEEGSSLTLTGSVGGSARKGLTKVGRGLVVLTGANTYGRNNGSGVLNATTVREGTLRLDFSQALIDENIVNNGITNWASNQISELALAGGNLEVKGRPGATNLQRFKDKGSTGLGAAPGFTIHAGASAVRAIQNGAASLTVDLGRLNPPLRFVGSTVDFMLPTTGGIVIPVGGVGLPDNILTANGAAFATVDGIDWAALDSTRKILPGSDVPGFYTPNGATSLSGNADMTANSITALTSSPTLTSLRFNGAGASTITADGQTLTVGGVLVTGNVGLNTSTISGGVLRGASTSTGTVAIPNQDLVVIQNNVAGDLVIDSAISDNGDGGGVTAVTALTKSGPGRLILTSPINSYTGDTHLNGGMLKLEGAAVIGPGKLFFHDGILGLPGGTTFTRAVQTAAGNDSVQFLGSGGFAAYGGDVTINFGGAAARQDLGGTGGFVPTGSALILGASDSDGTVVILNPLFLRVFNAPQQREIRVHNGAAPVDARLAGGFVGTFQDGGLTKTGNGTLEVGGAAGTYRGPTVIESGSLRFAIAGAIHTDSVMTVQAGALDLNGFDFTARHAGLTLGGGAPGTTSQVSTGAGTLTLATDVIYNGNIADDAGATISGKLALGTVTRIFTINDSSAVSKDLTISAAIAGSGGLRKAGAGTLELSGTNIYSGPTTIVEGALLVAGALSGTTSVNVSTGGTLGGTGSTNSTATVTVAAGGVLAPGAPFGILSTGSVVFNGGSLALDLSETEGIDRLSVAGSVSLNAPVTLVLTLDAPVTEGLSFILLENDALDEVMFSNPAARLVYASDTLDEGDLLSVLNPMGSQGFSISYAGGDGNDIVLTAVPEPASATMLMTSLGIVLGLRRFRRQAG